MIATVEHSLTQEKKSMKQTLIIDAKMEKPLLITDLSTRFNIQEKTTNYQYKHMIGISLSQMILLEIS